MDNKLIKTTKQIIENQSNILDGEISSKLNQARQKALLSKSSKANFFTAWYLPATAIAVLAMFLILPNIKQTQEPEIKQDNTMIIAEIDMLEQIELVENIEFYEWLSLEEETSSI